MTPSFQESRTGVLQVLLVEPVFFIHSEVYFRAALGSQGFEAAHFTIITSVASKEARDRALRFQRDHPGVELRLLEENPSQRTSAVRHWRANRKIIESVEKTLGERKFDWLVYLMADHVLPWFALPMSGKRFPRHSEVGVRGILLRDNGFRSDPAQSIKKRCRGAFERLLMRRAIRSGMVRKLSFLDPQSGARARNAFGPICGSGIDPIEIQPTDPVEARKQLGIPADSRVALIFGGLSERKGILETLDILGAAAMDTSTILLVIAGPVAPSIRDRLYAAISKAQRRYRVLFHDGFVPDALVPAYFASADCVICAYKEFNASSGVLLHAASFGKPALVSDGGVMGDAVRKYGFGEIVDLGNPEAFCRKFEKLTSLSSSERGSISENALVYAQSMAPKLFMSQFLQQEVRD